MIRKAKGAVGIAKEAQAVVATESSATPVNGEHLLLPSQLHEPVIGYAEGIEPWSVERIQEVFRTIKRYAYRRWVRSLQPKPVFPMHALVGSLGDLAHELACGTEVPAEFIFAASLTTFGAICSDRLRVNANVASEPRFYTVLLGKSYTDKKSTALRKAIEFFNPWLSSGQQGGRDALKVSYGVGSAEGMARELEENNRLLLAYDEFRALFDKTKVQSSVLLPMATSLFEATAWDNRTKGGNVSVRDAHLSLIGCCTEDTYSRMWSSEAIAIGLPNRLFVVWAERKQKVAWPEPPSEERVAELRLRIKAQIDRHSKIFEIAPDARVLWEEWYYALSNSVHTKRLDTIGFRLMAIFALTMDKDVVDLQVVENVIAILNYEFAIRMQTDPIDADNNIAALEEKIRRILKTRGPLIKRDLSRFTNAHKAGLWFFEQALNNLLSAGDIRYDSQKKFELGAEMSSELS